MALINYTFLKPVCTRSGFKNLLVSLHIYKRNIFFWLHFTKSKYLSCAKTMDRANSYCFQPCCWSILSQIASSFKVVATKNNTGGLDALLALKATILDPQRIIQTMWSTSTYTPHQKVALKHIRVEVCISLSDSRKKSFRSAMVPLQYQFYLPILTRPNFA